MRVECTRQIAKVCKKIYVVTITNSSKLPLFLPLDLVP